MHPHWGYRSIAKEVGCSPNLVKYYISPTEKRRNRERQTRMRANQILRLKTKSGGKCRACGYDKCFDVLCFHHLDPAQKEGQVSFLLKRSFQKAEEEIKKCVLLCANCHGEIHAGLRTLESSSGAAPLK